ncbi:MAG TPA: GAF domain-containing protein [Streptosporangiaceae bacterium]|nr:GAF domain-containing protein [Streptosporangiaceae bacterium]
MVFEKELTGDGIASLRWRPPSMLGPVAAPGDILPIKGGPIGPSSDSAARLAASFELMAALLAEADLADVLSLTVRHARRIGDADLAFIALPGVAPHTLEIHVATGANAEVVRGGLVRAGTSIIGRVFRTGRAMATQVATDPPLKGLPSGPILLLPLDSGERTCGVLALAGRPGMAPFTAAAKRQLLIFAFTSAAMIEIAEERRGADF